MPDLSKPRALRSHEKSLLEFMLSAEFNGRVELYLQAPHAQVVWECDCGCGTVNLNVSRSAIRAKAREPIPVEARGPGVDVLLFVRDGYLSSLEIVDHGDSRPLRYPSPGDLKHWVPPGKD